MKLGFSRWMFQVIKPFRQQIDERWPKSMFIGWGQRRYGRWARLASRITGLGCLCVEDGFLRSRGLGMEDNCVYSLVVDDLGIYYDATRHSRLEALLQNYDFASDEALISRAREAKRRLLQCRLSKYNHAPQSVEGIFDAADTKRILVIAQTKGDMSLHYGLATQYDTMVMIEAALQEHPGAKVYVKIHPDVLNGKRASDIEIEAVRQQCTIIDRDVNPIALLEAIDVVYTKTSQMGFEALMLGKACVCFGMPFYAGWGLTDDRVFCTRRKRLLNVDQVFAAAYLLYPIYIDPLTGQRADIFTVIDALCAKAG